MQSELFGPVFGERAATCHPCTRRPAPTHSHPPMPLLTLIARVTDGLILCASLEAVDVDVRRSSFQRVDRR